MNKKRIIYVNIILSILAIIGVILIIITATPYAVEYGWIIDYYNSSNPSLNEIGQYEFAIKEFNSNSLGYNGGSILFLVGLFGNLFLGIEFLKIEINENKTIILRGAQKKLLECAECIISLIIVIFTLFIKWGFVRKIGYEYGVRDSLIKLSPVYAIMIIVCASLISIFVNKNKLKVVVILSGLQSIVFGLCIFHIGALGSIYEMAFIHIIFAILSFVIAIILYISPINDEQIKENSEIAYVTPKETKQNKINMDVYSVSAADELKKFKELLDTGIITQEEYEAKKKQLLDL